MTRRETTHSEWAILSVLTLAAVAIVVVVQWPCVEAKAMGLDDGQYLLQNPLVRRGDLSSAGRFLTEVLHPSTVRGYYHPLSMISLTLDCRLGGGPDRLWVFHLTSLGIHAANAFIVSFLAYLLFRNIFASVSVGLLFGLHPLTVESVAWLAERKTVLAAFFTLISLVMYVVHAQRAKKTAYGGALLAYALALLSKPTATPLPVLLLLLDYWPLRRISRSSLIEKVPFLLLAAISSVVTVVSQDRAAGASMPGEHGLMHIVLTLCHNVVFYLYKIFWPVNMSGYYSFPSPFTLANAWVLGCVLGTVALTVVLIVSLRWTRALVGGVLFFYVAASPTMGVIGFHPVIAADRHAYLPFVGLLLVLACALGRVWNTRGRRVLVVAVIAILAGGEAFAARRTVRVWANTETLMRHYLAFEPDAVEARVSLGQHYRSVGKNAEAIEQYRAALEVWPGYAMAHNNLGNALVQTGDADAGVRHLRESVRLDPLYAEGHNSLGAALFDLGEYGEAKTCFTRALSLNPNDPLAHANLGNALAIEQRFEEAIEQYRAALRLQWALPEAHSNLAMALAEQGKMDEGVKHLIHALQLNPKLRDAVQNLAVGLAKRGGIDETLEQFRGNASIVRACAVACVHLGDGAAGSGEWAKAIASYRKAVAMDPGFAAAQNRLDAALRKLEDADPGA